MHTYTYIYTWYIKNSSNNNNNNNNNNNRSRYFTLPRQNSKLRNENGKEFQTHSRESVNINTSNNSGYVSIDNLYVSDFINNNNNNNNNNNLDDDVNINIDSRTRQIQQQSKYIYIYMCVCVSNTLPWIFKYKCKQQ